MVLSYTKNKTIMSIYGLVVKLLHLNRTKSIYTERIVYYCNTYLKGYI